MKISIKSFRLNVPTGTQAAAPVAAELLLNVPVVKVLGLYANPNGGTAQEINKLGVRLRSNGLLFLPENGSQDEGFTLARDEEGWLPVAIGTPYEVGLGYGFTLDGPPWPVRVEAYNTNANDYQIGGYIVACETEITLNEVIAEMRQDQKKYQRMIELWSSNRESGNINASKYITDKPT